MKESPLEKTTGFKIGFLTMAIAGFFTLVWLADENIPRGTLLRQSCGCR